MIGARLKAARIRAKHTQASLAEIMETDARQVWRWENEENSPSGEIVRRLALALEVTSDYLLGLTDDPYPASITPNLSAKERRVLSEWRRGARLEAIKVIAEDE